MKQAKYDLINVLFVFPTDFSVLQFPFDHNLQISIFFIVTDGREGSSSSHFAKYLEHFVGCVFISLGQILVEITDMLAKSEQNA